MLGVFVEVSRDLPLVLAVHPRTEQRLRELDSGPPKKDGQILMLGPQGYLDVLCLTSQAKLVITDSGGLQEETAALGIPCLTLRSNTERPITIEEGTSTLIGSDVDLLGQCVRDVLEGDYPAGSRPELWDGRAGRRVAALLADSVAKVKPTHLRKAA